MKEGAVNLSPFFVRKSTFVTMLDVYLCRKNKML